MSPFPAAETAALAVPSNKVTASVATYEAGLKVYNNLRTYWRANFAYTVTVNERDILYAETHAWLLSVLPDEKHRALLVSSNSSRDDYEAVPGGGSEEGGRVARPLTVRFNDETPRKVMIDGHVVTVSLEKPEPPSGASAYREPETHKIIFTTRTFVAQQSVIRHLERLNDQRASTRKAVLRMVGQWGSWKTRSDLPPRTLDSVSLPLDQKNRIVSDLGEFLESEDRYNRLAIPWTRGYMFHGPPGTGKTSIVKALANHFNLDLWYISLADLQAESSLLGLLAEVSPRSLLLLEDIDTMRITHDRDGSEQGKISMSSLLNTLDGVGTPHGLIKIMTTNRFDVLDSALTRAGRMDLIEEVTNPTLTTAADLYRHFYGRSPNWKSDDWDTPLADISASHIAEQFKRNMDDPDMAEAAVAELMGL